MTTKIWGKRLKKNDNGTRVRVEMNQERRKQSRSPIRLTVIAKNNRTGKVCRWLTKNISGAGLCLVVDELVERGSLFEIELKLPDFSQPFVLTG